MKPIIKKFTKIHGNATPYSIHGIKAKARIRVDQDVDVVLKTLKLKILDQPYDEVLLTTDKRFKHYKPNEDLIILKDGQFFRKNYGETGNIKYNQILVPKELVEEVLPEPARRIWQALRHYWENNCIQTEKLLPKQGKTDQTMVHVMSAMH